MGSPRPDEIVFQLPVRNSSAWHVDQWVKTQRSRVERCVVRFGSNCTKLVSLKRFFVKPLSHGVEHFVCVDDVVCREKDVFFL